MQHQIKTITHITHIALQVQLVGVNTIRIVQMESPLTNLAQGSHELDFHLKAIFFFFQTSNTKKCIIFNCRSATMHHMTKKNSSEKSISLKTHFNSCLIYQHKNLKHSLSLCPYFIVHYLFVHNVHILSLWPVKQHYFIFTTQQLVAMATDPIFFWSAPGLLIWAIFS